MMSTAFATTIPPLPPDTAGRWLPVECHDKLLIEWFLSLMRRVQICYASADAHDFLSSDFHRVSPSAGAYYYWTAEFQLAVALARNPQRGQHRIVAVAFAGSIPPRTAMGMIFDQCASYLRERKASTAYAVVRKQPPHDDLRKLFDVAPQCSAVRILVEHDYGHSVLWNIEFISLRP
jgi:hypothetical protein